MREGSASSRYWSADGHLLVAPDMNEHVIPILERAVTAYGPAWQGDGWAIGGVAFFGENAIVAPMPDHRRVLIALPMMGADDPDIAHAFLAHELVHCLCLKGEERTPLMIEEGAAVLFSLREVARRSRSFAARLREHQTTAPGTEHYAAALRAVELLLALRPDAIRVLRTQDPDWCAITPERIRAVVPAVTAEQAAVLCEAREMRPDWEGEVARAILAEEGA